MQERQSEDSKNLVGLELESTFYKKLESAMANEKNVTVVSGFKDSYKINGDKEQHFELDFIIISANEEAIFHMELKKSLTKNTLQKAKKQLDHGFNYFSKILTGQEHWRYVRLLGTDSLPVSPCSRCNPFVLLPDKLDNSKWSSLGAQLGKLFARQCWWLMGWLNSLSTLTTLFQVQQSNKPVFFSVA